MPKGICSLPAQPPTPPSGCSAVTCLLSCGFETSRVLWQLFGQRCSWGCTGDAVPVHTSVLGDARKQPVVSSRAGCAPTTSPNPNRSHSQKRSRQVPGETGGKAQTAQRKQSSCVPHILCACEGWSSGQWCAYFGRLVLYEARLNPQTSGAQPEEVSHHGLQPSAMQRGGAVGTKCSFLSWCFPGDSSFLCCPLWDFCELRVTCAAWFGLPPPLCLGYGHFRLELLPGPRTSYLTTSCRICVLVLQDQSVSACFPCWQASRGWQKAS